MRSCRWSTLLHCSLTALIGLALGLRLASAAEAPPPVPTAGPPAAERLGPISPERRAELQRTLEQNAPVLEAQAVVLKTVAKLIGPTVVHIEADVPQQTLQHNRDRHVEESGCGIIIQWKNKYYVLTNCHVVRTAPRESVRINLADSRQIHPREILVDPESDIAVLAVETPDLTAAPLGNSDRMEIGDFVLAVGSPFGLSHSVTFGIISAKGRRDLRLGDSTVRFQDFLQTDAAINPGNSGGPLCNLRGEVIGINTAIASHSGVNEGIGFSIPINMFMAVARQLIETGKVSRAFLGVSLERKFGPAMATEIGLPAPVGARVNAVTKDSPAESAHIQPGDVILEVDGTRVEDDAHLVNLISMMEIGKKVSLVIFRGGKTLSMSIEVSDRSKFGS